jgi:hypothetical protein
MLQLPGVRQKVLNETHGRINTNSRLSRLAEQLGWAIRQGSPTAVDRDCLRNASNRFFYEDPSVIPPRAPASQLSSEPHSFSRVFTGAFLDALSGMLIRQGGASDANLLAVSRAMGLLLVDGVRITQVVPRFYSQVAAGMITADRARNNGRFRGVLGNAFIRHGILSPADLARLPEAPVPQAVAAPLSEGFNAGAVSIGGFGEESYGEATLLSYGGAEDDSYRRGYGETPELPVVSLPGDYIGIPIKVHAAAEPARFAVTGGAPPTGAAEDMSAERDAQHFVEDLIQLGHIEAGAAGMMAGAAGVDMIVPTGTPDGEKTHELVPDADGQSLILKRKHFDCGFGGDH